MHIYIYLSLSLSLSIAIYAYDWIITVYVCCRVCLYIILIYRFALSSIFFLSRLHYTWASQPQWRHGPIWLRISSAAVDHLADVAMSQNPGIVIELVNGGLFSLFMFIHLNMARMDFDPSSSLGRNSLSETQPPGVFPVPWPVAKHRWAPQRLSDRCLHLDIDLRQHYAEYLRYLSCVAGQLCQATLKSPSLQIHNGRQDAIETSKVLGSNRRADPLLWKGRIYTLVI